MFVKVLVDNNMQAVKNCSINLVALKIVLYFTMKCTHKRAFGRWSR